MKSKTPHPTPATIPTDAPDTAIYRRVSTDRQQDSLDLQEKRCLEYCTFKGIQTHPGLIFGDPDTSGRKLMSERLGGRALLNRLALGDIRHLVIVKLDRLGRRLADTVGILEFLKERKITLHIIDLGGETITTQGHIGEFILNILLAVAQWEVAEIRDRTQKQMQDLFDEHRLTGQVPMGYDCLYTFANGATHLSNHALSPAECAQVTGDDAWLKTDYARRPKARKQLIPNHPEQAILRQLQAFRDSGLALNKVATMANALGYRTKLGRHWSTGAVDSVLNSRHTKQLLQDTPLEQAA